MIDNGMIKEFREQFNNDKTSKAVAGAVAKSGIDDASLNNEALRRHNHMFSVCAKHGEITEQKRSGRC